MKHILMPTDFSENSINAIIYGVRLFHDENCRFTILNTLYVPGTYDNIHPELDEVALQNAEIQLEKLVNRLQKIFKDKLPQIETTFRFGRVAGTISRIIKLVKTDLVIMGTKGANAITKKLIGTNASSVVRNVECPTLIVPGNCHFEQLERIAFTTDYDQRLVPETLMPILEIAKKYDAEILVLHIQPKSEEPAIAAGLEDYFDPLITSFHIIQGDDIPKGIDHFIKENQVDLAAMISHKLNLFERVFHRSKTRKITLHTEIPLLILHD